MHWAVLDTNVYINLWEGALAENALIPVCSRFIVRQSSVVLSELRRGARTAKARLLVSELRRLATVEWTPTDEDWWQAAGLVQKIGDAQAWDRRKRQEFQNDALIALTARRYGAAVVTANSGDFELLSDELGLVVLDVH